MEVLFTMTTTYLDTDYCIPDTESFLEHMKKHVPNGFDLERFKESFNPETTPIYYFDAFFKRVSKISAMYLWIQLPVLSAYGNPLFLSMRKGVKNFHGDLLGESSFLTYLALKNYGGELKEQVAMNLANFEKELDNSIDNTQCLGGETNAAPVKIDPESSTKLYVSNELVNEIKDTLLIDNWETMEGFRRLLLVTGARANYYVKNKKTDYYIINKLASIVVNTGLLNKYGQCIKVMYRWHAKAENYLPYKVIDSKAAYIDNDFTIADANRDLKPIVFLDEDSMPFSTDICHYDGSFKSLSHCTDDARRDRFPESVRDISDLYLTQKIQQELNMGLAIHRCGNSYAKPIYKSKENEIHWLLPLHVNVDISESPELVMVISERKGFYDIRTILPYNAEIRDWVRGVQPYCNLW